MAETVTLWRPTGPAELKLVEASGWKQWPPRLPEQPIFYPVTTRSYAVRITREWNVPEKGVGFVASFEVRREFLDRHEIHTVGGKECREYWIPAAELDELNANIVGGIREELEFRGPVPDSAFNEAERRMKRSFPPAWRRYMLRPSWFRRGWLSDECFLEFDTPSDSAERASAWEPAASAHPGVVILGFTGGNELLVVDARKSEPPVLSLPNVSAGWGDAVEQSRTVAEFVAGVDDLSFRIRF